MKTSRLNIVLIDIEWSWKTKNKDMPTGEK